MSGDGPDIIGRVVSGFLWDEIANSNGALQLKARTPMEFKGFIEGTDGLREIDLDASRANVIFGTSVTVQPASIRLLPIIKL